MSDIIPNLEDMTDAEKKAALDAIQISIAKSKEVQKKRIGENVGLVVDALKKIESDIRSRFDEVGTAIENRVNAIKDGRDGINGQDGKNGKDGRDGKQGVQGIKGKDGRDGRDGVDGIDGVSVTSAHIDFDGSLIIGLSSGVELNVGEVIAPSLAESIKVITNGGGTSQSVLDTLASLQTQITNLIPSQTGNSGKYLTTNGTALSWASVAGGLTYQGTWNASTNTPTLTSSVGTNGYYYIVATAGSTNLNGITDWQIGDWLMFNGSVWQKIDQSNLVTSVNGQTGAVSVGTVTSVSALTLGTTGTDLSSTVATSTTTPVITLNVPTASATNRGALSSADWTTFNNKGSGTVTSVTGTSPVASSGGASPAISLASAYGDTQNPYASKTANYVLAAPNGSAGVPTFRAVVAADIPTLNQNTTGTASNVTGTVAVANGGTGVTTSTGSGNNVLSTSPTITTPVISSLSSASATALTLQSAGTTAITIDTSQNVGIGVTPSAWNSAYKAMQVGFGASIYGRTASSTAAITSNAFVNSGGGFQYINTEAASNYLQGGGQHFWNIAASGTAGNAITFTEAMRIDSSGNVGIGTSSPNFESGTGKGLQVNYSGGLGAHLKLTDSASGSGTTDGFDLYAYNTSGYIENYEAGSIVFRNGGSERMRIDSSGNVLVNTTANTSNRKLNVQGSISSQFSNANDIQGVLTTDADTVVLAATYGSTGSYKPLGFNTSGTERMRIDSSGNLLVGTTSTSSPASGTSININSGGSFQDIGHANATASGTRYVGFIYNSGLIGSITQSGTTAVLYNLTSDQRLKENIQDADSASALIDAIQVRKFDWKSDSSHQRYGFIAQELVTVAPEAVYQPTDTEEMMAVDYSKLVPMLIKEVQSLRVRVAQLETN